jgi:hypothetical protein
MSILRAILRSLQMKTTSPKHNKPGENMQPSTLNGLARIAAAVVVAITSFASSPRARAVTPAPDGGYPGGNTAEGQNALLSLTTGTYNTAVGVFSILSDTTGSLNTGVGAGTLLSNIGSSNTATGAGALLSNTSGTDNTADGAFALFSNTAAGNTAIGSRSLLNNTTGGTLGNVQGADLGPNVAVGWQALESNTVASANTAVGYQALHDFATGPAGLDELGLSTAVGFQAVAHATGDSYGNSGFGYQALMNHTDGPGNTAIGFRALFNSSTGTLNTALGTNAGGGVTTASNVICIGSNVDGANVDSTAWISNVYGVTTQSGTAAAVIVSDSGQLGTVASAARFKKDIASMDKASEAILSLTPVTFHYKSDKNGTLQFGLVAEDVQKVNPDLVLRDKEGKPYSVRYEQINAMLLNEFLKEHKKVQELQATVAQQQKHFADQEKQIKALTSGLQRVTAQLELEKPAARLVRKQID